MSGDKICSQRKTKSNPDVYTLSELKSIALARGYKNKDFKDLKKKELCKLLNIKWIDPKSGPSRPKSSGDGIMYNKRPCDKTKSVSNPTAYTKAELVKLAVEKLKVSKGTASGMTKTEICNKMNDVKNYKRTKTTEDCAKRSKLPLKDHQLKIVNYLRTNRGIIAAFDTGSGKTLTAVVSAECFLDENPSGKVIVVAPKSLQENFKKEIVAYGGDVKSYQILTFDNFARIYESKKLSKDTMLIVDEAHEFRTNLKDAIATATRVYKVRLENFKNKKTTTKPIKPIVRVEVAIKRAAEAKKVLLLTATPIFNNPSDILNLVAMVKGEDKPMNDKAFVNMNSTQLCNYFRNTIMFYKNPKSDDYPSYKEHYVKIDMSPSYLKEYKAIETRNHHLWTDRNPWSFLIGMRQATNNLKGSQKYKWCINKIKEGKKTVIFSSFLTSGIKSLQDELTVKKIKFVEVSGSMTEQERKEAVDVYNKGSVKVLFITKAGGQGLDLKGTRNIVLLEKSWNRPQEEQVIGRAIRYMSHSHLPSSERNVNIYHLMLTKPSKNKRTERGSADEIMFDIIKRKTEVSKEFTKILKSVSLHGKGKGPACPKLSADSRNMLSPSKEERNYFKL